MNSEPCRPYTDDRDVIADDLGGNDNAEPGEVTAIREMASHAHAVAGSVAITVQSPSPEVVSWLVATGAGFYEFEFDGRRCRSFAWRPVGQLVTIIVDSRDEVAWARIPVKEAA